jgi:hypothetical protein
LLFIEGLGAKEGKMVIPFFTWVHVAKMQLKNSNPSTIVVPFSSLASGCQKLYFENLILMQNIYLKFLILMQKYILKKSTKNYLNKNIDMSLITNVLRKHFSSQHKF